MRPRLFLRSDLPHGLKPVLCQQPAVECGVLLLRGYKPKDRERQVSAALRAYAAMATSADKGAVRDISLLEN